MAEPLAFERREFLSKITATIGGATALAVTSSLVHSAPSIVPEQNKVEIPKAKGYQRTEHVDTYYQLADF